MIAAQRVAKIFERLVKLSENKRAKMSHAERIIWYVVTARCATDMDGFNSVFEQTFKEDELNLLIAGLQYIDEKDLSKAFARCRKLLAAERYFEHYDWNKVPEPVKKKIAKIGDVVGDRLWDFDEKLDALVSG